MTRDVVIIGAGPGGACAAIGLRRRGFNVLLLEKDRFPRPKLCGEFISPEVHRLSEELGIAEHLRLASPAELHIARLHLYGEPAIEIPLPAHALGLSRATLDELLLRRAAALGAEVCEQATVESAKRESTGHFTVTFQRGSQRHDVTARAVICAAGRWNRWTSTRTHNGTHAPRAAYGLKAHFKPQVASPGTLDLHFFEGGYCGIAPVEDGRANVCSLIEKSLLRPGMAEGDDAEAVLLAQPSLAAQLGSSGRLTDFLFTGPLIFNRPQPVADSMLMVGDSAAFIDPFCGDGISIAMHSGLLAATALAPALTRRDGAHSLDRVLADYSTAYHRNFASQFRWAARLRAVARSPRAARWAVRLAGSSRGLRSALFHRTRLNALEID